MVSVGGLAVEYLFKAVPSISEPARPPLHVVARTRVRVELHHRAQPRRARRTLLSSTGCIARGAADTSSPLYAKDPVCGMQVRDRPRRPPRTVHRRAAVYYFCSDHCQHRFTASPALYAGSGPAASPQGTEHAGADMGQAADSVTDPVCGMTVEPAPAAARAGYAGREYCFCGEGCARQFAADPLAVLTEAPDPVCGMPVPVPDAQFTAERDGVRYVFCGPACKSHFTAGAAEPGPAPLNRRGAAFRLPAGQMLASSWQPWRAFFEEYGYATIAPGWPDDPATVDEARANPQVFAGKSVGQVTQLYGRGHRRRVLQKAETPPRRHADPADPGPRPLPGLRQRLARRRRNSPGVHQGQPLKPPGSRRRAGPPNQAPRDRRLRSPPQAVVGFDSVNSAGRATRERGAARVRTWTAPTGSAHGRNERPSPGPFAAPAGALGPR